jgi:hypothetical protein
VTGFRYARAHGVISADEVAVVEAIADRLILPDHSGPAGKEAGHAAFTDLQLTGSFGDSGRLHMARRLRRALRRTDYNRP